MGELAIHPPFPTCHPQVKPKVGRGSGMELVGMASASKGTGKAWAAGHGAGSMLPLSLTVIENRGARIKQRCPCFQTSRPVVSMLS